jgi:hypothetical protein
MKAWREDLAAMGYRFQFITLAGWHALNLSMFELGDGLSRRRHARLLAAAAARIHSRKPGYRAAKHQAFVGTGYFDAVQTAITAGRAFHGRMAAAPRPSNSRRRRRAIRSARWPEAGTAIMSRRSKSRAALGMPDGAAAQHAAAIAEHFRALQRGIRPHHAARGAAISWPRTGRRAADAVARIELYEQRVARCVAPWRPSCASMRTDGALGRDQARLRDDRRAPARQRFLPHVLQFRHARHCSARSASTGGRILRDHVGRASGAVPIRVYRVGGSLPGACARCWPICRSAPPSPTGRGGAPHQRRDRPLFRDRPAERRARIHRADRAVFYRGMHAFLVGRSSATVRSRRSSSRSQLAQGRARRAVMLSRADVGSLFGYARSYFHVDLPVVSAAITLLRSFMPRKPSTSCIRCWAAPSRARPSATSRCSATSTSSIDSFVHAPASAAW